MDYATKLKNFPTVYYPSLNECSERRAFMKAQFDKYGISSSCYITDRYDVLKEHVTFICSAGITTGQPGIVHSFVNLVKHWYDSTEEDYALFCDDDIDFSTIDYWRFTWDDFINSLPADWDCVQLIGLCEAYPDGNGSLRRYSEEFKVEKLEFRERVWDDWGSTFLLRRSHAKKILDRHWKEPNVISLDILDGTWGFLYPIIEHTLYRNYGSKVYNFPMFLENINLSGFQGWDVTYNVNHIVSHKIYADLWKAYDESPYDIFTSKKINSKVNYTSLVESEDRRDFMQKQFAKYGIGQGIVALANRYSENKTEFKHSGNLLYMMEDGAIGAAITHLRMLSEWYNNTTEEYGIFCEDDIDFSTSENWNFTLVDFIERLPKDWECVQLIRIHKFSHGRQKEDITFRERAWDDWGSSYLVKRSYVKKILDHYMHDDQFILNVPGNYLYPVIEHVLYSGLGKVYNCPLVVERVDMPSTFVKDYDSNNFTGYDKTNKVKQDHFESSEYYKNMWKDLGDTLTLDDIFGIDYQKDFDWGTTLPEYASLFAQENFVNRMYEQMYQIKKGDVVLDFGGNAGAFTCSILPKKPKHIYCVEPSDTLIKCLQKNIKGANNVTLINAAVSDADLIRRKIEKERGVFVYENSTDEYNTITFDTIVKECGIDKVDFLKFDCEGGEYHIFTKENFSYINKNVKHMAGEWHITHHENAIEKFKDFRDLYLRFAVSYKAYDRYGYDVTKDILNDDYLKGFDEWHKNTYLGQFIIYINNV